MTSFDQSPLSDLSNVNAFVASAVSAASAASAAPFDFPGVRSILLYRRPTQFTALNPANPGYSDLIPVVASPRFTGASKLTVWNSVIYDFYGERPRAEQFSAAVPYLRGLPSSGSIFLAAPHDRPAPFIAWASVFLRPTPGALSTPAYRDWLLGIVRHKPGRPAVSHRVVGEDHQRVFANQDEFWNPHAFGFDVVPPGQMFEIVAGLCSSSSNHRLRMFDFGDPEHCRFQFGVMSLLPA